MWVGLHYDLEHGLSWPLTNVHDVIQINVLLLSQVRYAEHVQAEIEDNVRELCFSFAEVVEESTINLISEKVADGVAA